MGGDISRIAVLANKHLETWEQQALERLVETTDVEISLVVVNEPPDSEEPSSTVDRWQSSTTASSERKGWAASVRLFFHILLNDGPWAFVLAHRKLARKAFAITQEMFEPNHVESIPCLQNADFHYCTPEPTRSETLQIPSTGGVWKDLPADAVSKVRSQSDVAMRFGFGLIEGEILEAPDHGVLSFHSSDFTKYRGLASTERYLDDAGEATVTLQRLNNDIDGGGIVASETVDISDCHLQDEINNRLKKRQRDLLARGIRHLQDPDFEPDVPEDLAQYTTTRRKTEWRYCARVLLKEVANSIRKAIGKPRPVQDSGTM